MSPISRTLPFITVMLLAACSSESGTAATSSTAGIDPAAPVTQLTSDTSAASAETAGSAGSAAPVCAFASADDLAALFPGATAGDPGQSGNSCTLAMSTTAGTAYLSMSPSIIGLDDRQQQDTDLSLTISQVDGVGDRAYFSPGDGTFPQADLVFEKGGNTYAVRASYGNSGQPMVDQPALQDSLTRIAVAWAASI